MKNNKFIKRFLIIPVVIVLLFIFGNVVNAKVINTVEITRSTPPPPPVAPKKPEPTSPPTIPGDPTAIPTTAPTPTTVPSTQPQNEDGGRSSGTELSPAGASAPNDPGIGGTQVLGALTMAKTGVVEDAIFNSIFTLGSLLTSFGIIKKSEKYKTQRHSSR